MKNLKILFLLFILASCSALRVPSLKIMEKRADYDGSAQVKHTFKGGSPLFVPQKTAPVTVDIYIHPHETVHGDYFRGGFLRSIVEPSRWELSKKRKGKY